MQNSFCVAQTLITRFREKLPSWQNAATQYFSVNTGSWPPLVVGPFKSKFVLPETNPGSVRAWFWFENTFCSFRSLAPCIIVKVFGRSSWQNFKLSANLAAVKRPMNEVMTLPGCKKYWTCVHFWRCHGIPSRNRNSSALINVMLWFPVLAKCFKDSNISL